MTLLARTMDGFDWFWTAVLCIGALMVGLRALQLYVEGKDDGPRNPPAPPADLDR